MIDITKPITCNGQPVEVLTGWTKLAGERYCIVLHRPHLRAMMESNGRLWELKVMDSYATNTAPAPNLVAVGDKVDCIWRSGSPVTVQHIRTTPKGTWLWVAGNENDVGCFRRIEHLTLNGRPIEGVKP